MIPSTKSSAIAALVSLSTYADGFSVTTIDYFSLKKTHNEVYFIWNRIFQSAIQCQSSPIAFFILETVMKSLHYTVESWKIYL